MDLCMTGHDEIAWDGKGQCPACALGEEKDLAIDDLRFEIDDLNDENKELIKELEENGRQ